MSTSKIVFISYSHDSDEHMAWVKKFADDLASIGGFDVIYDQNLPKGASFPRFMELGISSADKVLVIGTPNYVERWKHSSGVSYEEAIIGTELLGDIDSLKYYPILRSGTYNTSFPPILQGRHGDDLSDDSKYKTVLKNIIEAIQGDSVLPSFMEKAKVAPHIEPAPIASLYFSVNVLYETMFNMPTSRIEGIAFGLTVTNLSKEPQYFTQPYFKSSVPFEGNADSFVMLNVIGQTESFPVRLERGQQFSQVYRLVPGNIEMFSSLLNRDANATLTAVIRTTVGDLIAAEPYKLADLVKLFKYIN